MSVGYNKEFTMLRENKSHKTWRADDEKQIPEFLMMVGRKWIKNACHKIMHI